MIIIKLHGCKHNHIRRYDRTVFGDIVSWKLLKCFCWFADYKKSKSNCSEDSTSSCNIIILLVIRWVLRSNPYIKSMSANSVQIIWINELNSPIAWTYFINIEFCILFHSISMSARTTLGSSVTLKFSIELEVTILHNSSLRSRIIM